jgi:hypothetical protein
MPVLIVSEKTCPHDGFSRKRSILPSSSVTTIPNSSGFSTDFRPDRHGGVAVAMELEQRAEVDVAERVAGDDEHRVVQLARREPDRSGRPQR